MLIGIDVMALINLLAGLPLAIVIAGTFMHQTGTGISEYLRYYQDTWHELQAHVQPERYYRQGNIL